MLVESIITQSVLKKPSHLKVILRPQLSLISPVVLSTTGEWGRHRVSTLHMDRWLVCGFSPGSGFASSHSRVLIILRDDPELWLCWKSWEKPPKTPPKTHRKLMTDHHLPQFWMTTLGLCSPFWAIPISDYTVAVLGVVTGTEAEWSPSPAGRRKPIMLAAS